MTLDDVRFYLSGRFTDRECAAYAWLMNRNIRPWVVDLATKEVTAQGQQWPTLVDYAAYHGWEG